MNVRCGEKVACKPTLSTYTSSYCTKKQRKAGYLSGYNAAWTIEPVTWDRSRLGRFSWTSPIPPTLGMNKDVKSVVETAIRRKTVNVFVHNHIKKWWLRVLDPFYIIDYVNLYLVMPANCQVGHSNWWKTQQREDHDLISITMYAGSGFSLVCHQYHQLPDWVKTLNQLSRANRFIAEKSTQEVMYLY